VHCTAGKDRAGFASAVILLTLGVPEESVYEDFLLTNHYTAQRIERTLWTIRLVSLFRVDPEQVRPVLGVERGYLAAALDEIEKRYGSFDAYRREALGFDDAETQAFRELALEGPSSL
jgi:protein-tyrosine phosphatase